MKLSNQILILLFLAIPFIGTSQDTSISILGTWTFNYEASASKMDAKTKTYLGKLPSDRQNNIKQSYQERRLTFNEDGTLIQTNSDSSELNCTWSLKDDNKVLEVVYPDGLVYPQNIEYLSSDRLVLIPKAIGKGQLFFSEWHFTKN